jgi:hypothetical protein
MASTSLDQPVVHDAQLEIYRACWRLPQEQAVWQAAASRGLTLTPLWPPYRSLQIATLDGRLLGRVRQEHRGGLRARWFAMPSGGRGPLGPFPTSHAAARALARHVGLLARRVRDTA